VSDPWPWSGDTPAEKARRVARSYRDRLEFADPDACARLDREMTRLGQRWVLPTVATYTEDDLLPADLVADYAHVSLKAVYGWRKRGMPSITTPDGIRFRFCDVRRWLGRRGA
jgi:hypothetical protein